MTDTSNSILAKKNKGQEQRLILAPQDAGVNVILRTWTKILSSCQPWFPFLLQGSVRVRKCHCNVPPRVYWVLLIFESVCACMLMGVHVHKRSIARMQKPREQRSGRSRLSFHHVGGQIQTQVIRLDSKSLYLLKYLDYPV